MVARARIRGNKVYGNRARGFVIKTRDAIVEDNEFISVDGAGIFVAVEGKFWREAIGTRDVIVRDNTFFNCNGGPSRSWGVIAVFALLEGKGHRMGSAGVHRRLLVEGNRIAGTDNCGIYVSSTDGAVIRGNRIRKCCRKPSRPGGRHAIYLLNCRNVTIEKNELTDPGAGMTKALGLGRGVDSDTLTMRANPGLDATPAE
jgi:parallel beta-helix repeat protein